MQVTAALFPHSCLTPPRQPPTGPPDPHAVPHVPLHLLVTLTLHTLAPIVPTTETVPPSLTKMTWTYTKTLVATVLLTVLDGVTSPAPPVDRNPGISDPSS